jgi:hypothetical protein
MTYSISISGHLETLDDFEARRFEQAALEAAQAFVAELDGTTSAVFSRAASSARST